MTTLYNSGLIGIKLKLTRAQEHLNAITIINARFSAVECKVSFTVDYEKDLGFFVIDLPQPPLEICTIVGDCLHNLRSILDYLVWQIVLSNQPEKPDNSNMFPICSSPENFRTQVKRRRLSGVPMTAVSIIEKFQPYNATDHPLALLNKLYNADKHRDLNFTIAVASDLDISYIRNGEVYLRTILGNDEVRSGAILGNVGIPLSMTGSLPEVQINGKAECFVAFKDIVTILDDAVGVVETLEEIMDFIADKVVPSLKPFIH